MIRAIQALVASRAMARRMNIAPARRTVRPAVPAWLRYPAVLAAAALLAMGSATGCSSQPRLVGACGVAVDGSNSGNATTGFDASTELHKQLYNFLQTANCRYVVFGPINGASQQSVCTQPELDMDPNIQGSVDRQQLHAEAFAAAMQRSIQMLNCARYDKLSIHNASDIVGGLVRIAQARPNVPGPYSILVVSDFRNWTPELRLSWQNLTTQASRAALVNDLASRGLVPNFHGAHVYTAGFGALAGRNPARYVDFNDFWRQYMSRANAQFQPNGL